MTMSLEQQCKAEAAKQSIRWNKGPFNFILQRTFNHYHKDKVAARRASIAGILNLELNPLTDDVLKSLYQFACQVFLAKCQLKFEHSGFQKTPSERKLLETIHQVIHDHPEFRHIEIYPSVRHSKDFPPKLKMVIGCYVPDLIVFGLKKDGYGGAFIEVDGDSHAYQYGSDMTMYDRLAELGLFPLPIPNEKSTDYGFVLGIFQELSRSRSGALDEQIKRNKRVLWCKTVACNEIHQIGSVDKNRLLGIRAHLFRKNTPSCES